MKKALRYISPFLVLIIAVLVFTRPTEDHFLKRISSDYGQLHGGIGITEEMLNEMGESDYQSYFLYSTYHYRFGTIGVAYVGIGGQIFYLGSTDHHGSRIDTGTIKV